MTLEEIKQLKLTLTRSITFPLMEDISEDYLHAFLEAFIPKNYDKKWEDMTEEEIGEALVNFNYNDHYELEDLMDASEIEVKIERI